MHIQKIGKDFCRITTKSKAKQKKLSKIPGVIIEVDRIIFPEKYRHQIEKMFQKKPKKRRAIVVQLTMF